MMMHDILKYPTYIWYLSCKSPVACSWGVASAPYPLRYMKLNIMIFPLWGDKVQLQPIAASDLSYTQRCASRPAYFSGAICATSFALLTAFSMPRPLVANRPLTPSTDAGQRKHRCVAHESAWRQYLPSSVKGRREFTLSVLISG